MISDVSEDNTYDSDTNMKIGRGGNNDVIFGDEMKHMKWIQNNYFYSYDSDTPMKIRVSILKKFFTNFSTLKDD